MTIVWRPDAVADLDALHSYIAENSPSSAALVIERILLAVALLSEFPLTGRPGRIAETRERPVARTSYVIAYRSVPNRLTILRIYHASRKWPIHLQ